MQLDIIKIHIWPLKSLPAMFVALKWKTWLACKDILGMCMAYDWEILKELLYQIIQ